MNRTASELLTIIRERNHMCVADMIAICECVAELQSWRASVIGLRFPAVDEPKAEIPTECADCVRKQAEIDSLKEDISNENAAVTRRDLWGKVQKAEAEVEKLRAGACACDGCLDRQKTEATSRTRITNLDLAYVRSISSYKVAAEWRDKFQETEKRADRITGSLHDALKKIDELHELNRDLKAAEATLRRDNDQQRANRLAEAKARAEQAGLVDMHNVVKAMATPADSELIEKLKNEIIYLRADIAAAKNLLHPEEQTWTSIVDGVRVTMKAYNNMTCRIRKLEANLVVVGKRCERYSKAIEKLWDVRYPGADVTSVVDVVREI